MLRQLRVTLDRIAADQRGAPWDVVKIATFGLHQHGRLEGFHGDNKYLFAEFFEGFYPANTLVDIKALSASDLEAEVEAIAELR